MAYLASALHLCTFYAICIEVRNTPYSGKLSHGANFRGGDPTIAKVKTVEVLTAQLVGRGIPWLGARYRPTHAIHKLGEPLKLKC